MGTNNMPSCQRNSSKYPIKPPDLPLKSTLIVSELPLSRTNFNGPKGVRAIEVRLNKESVSYSAINIYGDIFH